MEIWIAFVLITGISCSVGVVIGFLLAIIGSLQMLHKVGLTIHKSKIVRVEKL